MKEYSSVLATFSDKGYSMYSNIVPCNVWGNLEIAEKYLEKYWLPAIEFERLWRRVQERVFFASFSGLPEMVFRPEFELFCSIGGCLFVREEFEALQKCMQAVSDDFLFVIENSFSERTSGPVYRMKYPSDITWDEITSGNFASAVLLEMPHKEYFVFGDTGLWGRYVANDYECPLDITAFTPKFAHVFKKNLFPVALDEHAALEHLPLSYRTRFSCE